MSHSPAGRAAERQMSHVVRWLLAGGMGLALAACQTRGGDIPYAPANFPPSSFETQGIMQEDIPLGPLDVVEVAVFRVPDLSGKYQVNARGIIEMPLVGSVNARNRSADQLARELESMYGQRYLRDPQISVRVIDGGQQNITVEGAVLDPGLYPVRGTSNLLSALAMANGVDPQNGNPRRVAIFRKSQGQTIAAAFDILDIRRGRMENPTVYPGDLIVVDGAGTRAIYRDIIQALPALAIFSNL